MHAGNLCTTIHTQRREGKREEKRERKRKLDRGRARKKERRRSEKLQTQVNFVFLLLFYKFMSINRAINTRNMSNNPIMVKV